MGGGRSGLYSGTYSRMAYPISAYYMDPTDGFSVGIKKRKDIDTNGFYDVIAHGETSLMLFYRNGKTVEIDHRVLAKLLKHDIHYSKQSIRLLSCRTGASSSGFAQNLANKLNVPVKAPTDFLWVLPWGKYFVAGGKIVNGRLEADLNKIGKFKTFYPKRRKK